METLTHDDETGKALIPVEGTALDLGSIDPAPAFRVAETLVKLVAQRCQGPRYIAPISGKNYPKVEWWTTVGASLGLFPREESNHRLERADEIAYEAIVGVYRGDSLVARASALCSSREKRWSRADEYAIKSMATTRATGKAYRIGLSFLAVMAGLEPTSAEEIPPNGFPEREREQPPEWETSDRAPEPDAPGDAQEPPPLSKPKQGIAELLAPYSSKQRDAAIRKYSQVVVDGQPVAGKVVDSYDRMMTPAISDKWASATLGKMRQALAEKGNS